MKEQFFRTQMLLGEEGLDRLQNSRIAIFGIGGVGGYAAEALARCGIGQLDLIDNDTVSISNLNRQIIALHSNVGQLKVDVAKQRILDINPEAAVRTFPCFYLPENADQFDFTQYDYVVDAIDTVTGKLSLVQQAAAAGTPIISAMGTGNKLAPSKLEVTDISKTSMCPLARIMRKELRNRGIHHLTVVYSTEEPLAPQGAEAEMEKLGKRQIPGSTAFVPGTAGLLIASKIVRDLTGK